MLVMVVADYQTLNSELNRTPPVWWLLACPHGRPGLDFSSGIDQRASGLAQAAAVLGAVQDKESVRYAPLQACLRMQPGLLKLQTGQALTNDDVIALCRAIRKRRGKGSAMLVRWACTAHDLGYGL